MTTNSAPEHSAWLAARNLSLKALRRAVDARKPLVRAWKRSTRWNEQRRHVRAERAIERQIAAVARAQHPIVVGPWLSEVGYEILYWIPFLRWWREQHGVPPERIVAVSRGGVAAWYQDIASTYIDIFDHIDPQDFSRRNELRRRAVELGGRKQRVLSPLDEDILSAVRNNLRVREVTLCHPTSMYGLFQQFWYGNRGLEFLLQRTRFRRYRLPDDVELGGLPCEFVAVKFHSGTALSDSPGTREVLRSLVARLGRRTRVVVLDTGIAIDDHDDYLFRDIPGVSSARTLVTPRNNLGVQTQIAARARAFVGTCGGLGWLAPLLGVQTVALFTNDRFLAPHLYVARHAYRLANAAPFSALDLNGCARLDLLDGGGDVGLCVTSSASDHASPGATV